MIYILYMYIIGLYILIIARTCFNLQRLLDIIQGVPADLNLELRNYENWYKALQGVLALPAASIDCGWQSH